MKKLAIFTATVLLFSMFGSGGFTFAQEENLIFSDITAYNINYDAIGYLKDEGVIDGYPDGSYGPQTEINRAEFTKIVMGAAYGYDPNYDFIAEDIYSSSVLSFSDVENGAWYIPYLRKAIEYKVIDGYPDGTFKPGDNINFAEAAKIIANSFGIDLGAEDPETWYRKYVEALQNQKAIPMSVEFFDEKITRDEMAEMVYRIKADVKGKSTRTYLEINGEQLISGLTCDELSDRFDQRYYSSYYYGVGSGAREEMAVMPAATPVAGDSATSESSGKMAEGGGGGYSTTNIQVAGVDEADIIKNDGKYIYLIKNDTVRIIDAYPSSGMKELVVFSFGESDEEFYPSDLYVDGNRLIVIGSSYVYTILEKPVSTAEAYIIPPPYYENRTKVYILDITNRSVPKVERTVSFEGSYNSSRRVGETLYMVINRWRGWIPYADERPILPLMKDSAVGSDEEVASCGKVHILPKPQDLNYLITAAIPLDDSSKEVVRSVVVGDGENIYSSQNYLYVAATDWGGGYYRPFEERGTIVYRYQLGKGSIEYSNKGKVPGHVLNQFSMDEYLGHFRIATTSGDWGETLSNNLFILGSDMKVTGQITGIAPTEQIYSVRFMGNRAYMVTFKQTDPLFVIDLSNVRAPKILGELKIPGFSNYLHPYDETHLIGFGKDVDEELAGDLSGEAWLAWEAVQGMKLGLFDVTDVNNPKEMFSELIGDRGTSSELLYNHKALLFDKSKNLLAFPITVVEIPDDQCSDKTYSTCPDDCWKICVPSSCISQDGVTVCTPDCDGAGSCVSRTWNPGNTVFAGAYVYNVDLQKGFTFKGGITHLSEEEVAEMQDWGYPDYYKTVQRIIYIGQNLYTVSQSMVKANDINTLAEKNAIELAGSSYDYY